MTGPNTQATAMTRPVLATILKIERACQRRKTREEGGGKESNKQEVV